MVFDVGPKLKIVTKSLKNPVRENAEWKDGKGGENGVNTDAGR